MPQCPTARATDESGIHGVLEGADATRQPVHPAPPLTLVADARFARSLNEVDE